MNEQEVFWKELQGIQNYIVEIFLLKQSKYEDMDAMLCDVTYETFYKVMELVDGYKNKEICYEIKNKITNACLNRDIDLHNDCERYLRCSDI